jgi:predicted SAM-dependent methyltransferase
MAQDLASRVTEVAQQGGVVRLHLGSGPVIMPGWINVDGDYMSHHPDVIIHDITQPLPLPDGSVHEILSVHVIEHIMPHLVPVMLQDWLRVLEPGGCVAVEWPDLLKICQRIVEDPSCLYSTEPKTMKATIAGIFGNISKYRDVAMLHKWGYSAESLSVLMKRAGFQRVETQENHYRKSKVDSRVVGYK